MMNAEALQAFLAKPNEAIIAVNRVGKGALLTPVHFLWEDETFYFATLKAYAKYLLMKRDPNISLLVNDHEAHGYVAAYGTAKILEIGEARPHIFQRLLEKYVPEERREQYSAALARRTQTSERIVVEFHPEKILCFGGLVPE
jgi:nitroimidazol reductase NimA-like FMN-containing flavoprotein (pyridoxamine 5'-phosphate oxidase superfamily)